MIVKLQGARGRDGEAVLGTQPRQKGLRQESELRLQWMVYGVRQEKGKKKVLIAPSPLITHH
jgi:hypothetical protein